MNIVYETGFFVDVKNFFSAPLRIIETQTTFTDISMMIIWIYSKHGRGSAKS